ncbi:MAG TPA: hypothetical protein VMY05_12490 [Acidobacteriota bacterium]|nr:hypothetical protein [Acidobacteriota bacterium]
MRKIAFSALLLLLTLALACSDDEGDDSNGPGPTGPPRVIAFQAASSPTLDSVADPLWDSATAKTIEVTTSALGPQLPREERQAALAVSDQVLVEAIRYENDLYLRLTWDDESHDVWPKRWVVDSLVSGFPDFSQGTTASEDQLLFMFAGLAEDGWDTWHWRALTTAIEEFAPNEVRGFAEGATLRGIALQADSGNLEIALPNLNDGFNQPTYFHPDSSEFTGYILYQHIAVDPPTPTAGWSAGQYVPGYRIDSSMATPAKAEARASRWDIRAVSRWSGGAQYQVVLSRPMTSGFSDDLEMVGQDSVKVRVGIANDFDFRFDIGSTRQGFTSEFWLIL